MNRKEEIKKELEELSPNLAKLKKGNPFRVPANYFEQLPDQIMEQAKWTRVEKSVEEVSAVSWLDRIKSAFVFLLKPQVALAALGIVAITWTVIFTMNETEEGGMVLADQSIDAVTDAYVLDHIDEFEIEDLALLAFEEENPAAGMDDLMDIDEEEVIDEILDGLEVEDIESFL